MSTRERLTNLYETYLKKRPRQSRSRGVVDAILHAALDRLSRTGDEDVVEMKEIAERAGVGIGSLYDYFSDRERLLAAIYAKVTEENLLKFEEVLVRTRALPLRAAIELVVDFAFDVYLKDIRLARALVRIVAANDAGPTLIRSQDVIAQRLAVDLAKRDDVNVEDCEAAGWLVTNAMMGVVHTLIWDDDARLPRARLREATVSMLFAYLSSASSSSEEAPAPP